MSLAYDNMEPVSDAPDDGFIAGVVLVVDDHPDTLALLSDVLGGDGYTVIAAVDGRTALERARMITPDIVLLDARMPGMDGFEVCLRMNSDPVLSDVPVIFMTGLTESEHIVKGFRAGGADYVTKPVKPDEVRVRVEAHLSRARARRQADMVVNAGGRAAVIVGQDGVLRWRSSRASAHLERYFDIEGSDALPTGVMRWLRQAEPTSRPYEIADGQSRLSVRLAGPAGETAGFLPDRIQRSGFDRRFRRAL